MSTESSVGYTDRITTVGDKLRKIALDLGGYLNNKGLAGDHDYLTGNIISRLNNLADAVDGIKELDVLAVKHSDYLDIWNRNCGQLPKIRVVTPDRKHRIDQMVRLFKTQDEAKEALTIATRVVANDPWWLGDNPTVKRYGFDNLVPNKVVQKMEDGLATIESDEQTKALLAKFKPGQSVEVYGYLVGTVVSCVTTAKGYSYVVDVGGQRVWCDESQLSWVQG